MNIKLLLQKQNPILLFIILSISLIQAQQLVSFRKTELPAPFKKASKQTPKEQLNLLSTDVTWFPKGSAIQHIYGGSVQISAPKGWTYIATDKRTGIIHSVLEKSTIELACRCSQRSDCKSYIQKSEHYCNTKGSCTECTTEAKIMGIDVATAKQIQFEVQSGGFVNIEKGVQFETMSQTLPMVFSEMFEYPMITQAIEKFLRDVGLEELINHQYKEEETCHYFALNVFGRRAIIAIPESMLKNSIAAMLMQSGLVSSDRPCLCECTQGNCDLKNFMGLMYCENNNCLGICTLTNQAKNNSLPKAMMAKFYLY